MGYEDRFVYLPTYRKGVSEYDGTPIASHEAYEILGKDGIEELDCFISKLISLRKLVLGRARKEAYGLDSLITIFDMKSRIALYLRDNPVLENLHEDDFEIFDFLKENPLKSFYAIDKSPLIELGITERKFKNRVNRLLNTGSFLLAPVDYKIDPDSL